MLLQASFQTRSNCSGKLRWAVGRTVKKCQGDGTRVRAYKTRTLLPLGMREELASRSAGNRYRSHSLHRFSENRIEELAAEPNWKSLKRFSCAVAFESVHQYLSIGNDLIRVSCEASRLYRFPIRSWKIVEGAIISTKSFKPLGRTPFNTYCLR